MKIAIIRKSSALPDEHYYTKVTSMGNVTELIAMEHKPAPCPCVRINAEEYCDTRTGEIKQYNKAENRAGSLDSMRHTLANIRALINTNVTEPSNCRWVTLTYEENMTDTKRLYEDYNAFWKRFLRHCKKMGYARPDYITVQEPQGRGAWHIHAFFIWQEKAPFIPSSYDAKAKMKDPPKGVKCMQELWEQGFTSVKALNDVDNIGAYFSAYLADMPLVDLEKLPNDEKMKVLDGTEIVMKSFTNEQETVKDKKFIKGGRLALYPTGMNIVRRTKGIKDPDVEYMTYKNAKEKVCSAKQTFSTGFDILDDSGDVKNKIFKSYYNSKRK